MDKESSGNIPIMPVNDPSFWELAAKWLAGIASSLAIAFAGFLRWWVGDRFHKVDKRLDEHDLKIAEHEIRHAEHHEGLSVLVVHIENGTKERARIEQSLKETREESRKRFDQINDKLDKLVERF